VTRWSSPAVDLSVAGDAHWSAYLADVARTLAAATDPVVARLVRAAADLPAGIVARPQPRVVEVTGGPAETAWMSARLPAGIRPLRWPEPVRERHDRLTLDDDRIGQALVLSGWPAAVEPDWLSDLAVLPELIGLAVHVRPVDAAAAEELLRRRLGRLTSAAAADRAGGRLADPTVGSARADAHRLRERLARAETGLAFVQVLVAAAAPDQTALAAAVRRVRAVVAGRCARLRTPWFAQREAWAAAGPDGRPLGRPPGPDWRLVDTAVAAATIPVPVMPVGGDDDGVLAGLHAGSDVAVRVDRFAARNANRIVAGTSGAGKSYAAKLEVLRWAAAGARVVVVDPEGEFGPVAAAAGGVALAVGEEPAGLDPVGVLSDTGGRGAAALSLLAGVLSALLGSPLTTDDLALLDQACRSLADRSDPTLPDLVDALAAVAGEGARSSRPDLSARLRPVVAGTVGTLFAGRPPAPLLSPVVYDLRAVPDRMRAAVTACVLARTWTDALDRATDTLLVVDEAHLLLADDAAATLLAGFTRRARKYRLGLELVTQRLSDFLADTSGQAIVANAAHLLLLGCEPHERQTVADGLSLTAAQTDRLQPDRIGAGLLLTPAGRIPVRVVATDREHAVAASGPRRVGTWSV
jgi:hypothetical protein